MALLLAQSILYYNNKKTDWHRFKTYIRYMFEHEFSLEWPELDELIASDPGRVELLFSQFAQRIFNARHVGISSQELQSWEGQGFLPHKYKDNGWRKFSFLETVWLKCIQKLRSMDVSYKKILSLKEYFFKLETAELKRILKYMPMPKAIGVKKYLMMAKLELDDEYRRELLTFLHEGQYSRFSFLVLWVLMSKSNVCLLMSDDDSYQFIVLGQDGFKDILDNEVMFGDIQHKSFILLNLRSVVHDFFEDDKLELSNDYLVSFLSAGQKKVLEKMKEQGIKSITIRFNDGGEPTHLEIKKGQITDEVLNKVGRFLNKKSFKDIEFKVRNGELIKYEETDILKL